MVVVPLGGTHGFHFCSSPWFSLVESSSRPGTGLAGSSDTVGCWTPSPDCHSQPQPPSAASVGGGGDRDRPTLQQSCRVNIRAVMCYKGGRRTAFHGEAV